MSFFGRVLKNGKEEEIDIPSGFTLTLLMASYDGNQSTAALLVRVGSEPETAFQLATLDSESNRNCPIQAEFSHGDSPIVLCSAGRGERGGGGIHVTGRYGYDAAAVEDEEEEEGGGETEKEGERAVVNEARREEDQSKRSSKKKRKSEGADKPSSAPASGKPSRTEAKKARAQEREEEASINARLQEYAQTSSSPAPALSLPPWKVRPEGGEGVAVPAPRRVNKQGVLCTDYIVGCGKVPKLGSVVKLTYEGMFPDGEVFDKNLKRSKPLSFRKGAGQVVRGMDIGIESMRIGGSRELVIPSHLGYVSF